MSFVGWSVGDGGGCENSNLPILGDSRLQKERNLTLLISIETFRNCPPFIVCHRHFGPDLHFLCVTQTVFDLWILLLLYKLSVCRLECRSYSIGIFRFVTESDIMSLQFVKPALSCRVMCWHVACGFPVLFFYLSVFEWHARRGRVRDISPTFDTFQTSIFNWHNPVLPIPFLYTMLPIDSCDCQ